MAKTDKLLLLATAAVLFLVLWAQLAAYFALPTPLSAGRQGEQVARVAAVSGDYDRLFGRLTVKSKEGYSLPDVLISINGRKVGDLTSGSILLRVYEGDKIAIDCRNYSRELVFCLQDISGNIKSDLLPKELSVLENIAVVGTVRFK